MFQILLLRIKELFQELWKQLIQVQSFHDLSSMQAISGQIPVNSVPICTVIDQELTWATKIRPF